MKSADQAASARGPHALLARLTGGPRPGAQPQGEMRGAESSRVRLQTIVALRWLAIIGQLIAVLVVALGFDFPLPLGTSLAAIAASAWLNIFLTLRYPPTTRLPDTQAAIYFAFDILQLAVLLYLTGGLENPFSVLFLAPVTIAATTLPLRPTLVLIGLAMVCIVTLAFVHMPLPWNGGAPLALPLLYVIGIGLSLLLGVMFMTVYARRVTQEQKRMADALSATQAVLARAQRLSALDGLAAAAAHELGTPLGTISLTAKELKRGGASPEEMQEDIALIHSQAERCKEILSLLAQRPAAEDALHSRLLLSRLLEEVVRPHREMDVTFDITLESLDGSEEPQLLRRPEILYGLGNVIENAADFADTTVEVAARYDEYRVRIQVRDDGPGFSLEVLDRLGEPYVTTRPRLSDEEDPEFESESLHEGMGLGFFIAKTLLERSGARMEFGNRGGGHTGAVITLTWSRAEMESDFD